jgi:HPt (histidine-containing phosphotransfer) domain-containing protein
MPERRSITADELTLLDPDGTFSSRLAADRDVLTGLARGLGSAPTETRQRRLAEMEALAHRLGGAAGTFGYMAISAAALELEAGIVARRGRAEGPFAEIEDRLAALMAMLDEALRKC